MWEPIGLTDKRPALASGLVTIGVGGAKVNCKSCGSENVSKFRAEISIRFPELKDIKKPAVMIFPELLICLDCGIALFTVLKAELGVLAKRDASASG